MEDDSPGVDKSRDGGPGHYQAGRVNIRGDSQSGRLEKLYFVLFLESVDKTTIPYVRNICYYFSTKQPRYTTTVTSLHAHSTPRRSRLKKKKEEYMTPARKINVRNTAATTRAKNK